jgi:hypothetical protein
MGEPHRSPQISLSPQQLQEGSFYLRQVSLGLAALTQMNSGNLATAMATFQVELSSETPELHPRNVNSEMDFGRNINNLNSRGIDLNFSQLSDRLLSPIPSNSLGNSLDNSLTFPELACGVQVLVHLCQQHQELIRRAVSLMEQITQEGQDPWQVTLLKDYSQRLAVSSSLHQPLHLSEAASNQWRGKILFDLLFYSSPYGQQRLWLRCTQPVNIGKS